MPINTEAENRYMIFDNVGQTHYFALEFERMPEGKAFNILEDESNPNAYNFYSVLVFPLLGWLRDLHPLNNAHAERTTKKRSDCFSHFFGCPVGLEPTTFRTTI